MALPLIAKYTAGAATWFQRVTETINNILRGEWSALFQDGTAAEPSIAFRNEPDTGLYLADADTLGVTAGGTERVRVYASSGETRVQVGTGGAVASLYVGGITTDSENAVRLHQNSGSGYIDHYGSGSLNIRGGTIGGTTHVQISNAGAVSFHAIGTTASGANAFLDSGANNNLLRSTSSRRYKTDIEDVEPARIDAILQLRPVWYRSLSLNDRIDWSWYGLIAEEVAVIEPRLVHWIPRPDNPETLIPDSVMYDRLAVLLLGIVKRLEDRTTALEQLKP